MIAVIAYQHNVDRYAVLAAASRIEQICLG